MEPLPLHEVHQMWNGRFGSLNGAEVVADYGAPDAEYAALQTSAGVLDLSFRSRLCLTGADRQRFLHGQVTNSVKSLAPGQGCYAALVTAKGKLQSDLNVYCLADELLLDFEPGLSATVTQRLEKYIVADDVQVVDVAGLYGLLSVQGPQAEAVVRGVGLWESLSAQPFHFSKLVDPTLGELYLVNQPRLGTVGFDWFVPTGSLGAVADKLVAAARAAGGRLCGWQAFETARIEAGMPRFGADMDESNFPQEGGIEDRAMSYSKGCYIGQEVLNRIHTMGHVNRELRALRLADDLAALPAKGAKLFQGDKEVGQITSATVSPQSGAKLALGYVRREAAQLGSQLRLENASGASLVQVEALPFKARPS